MKLPTDRTGLNTIGLAGCIILAGVVFGAIGPWWLIASGLCLLSGVGLENNFKDR